MSRYTGDDEQDALQRLLNGGQAVNQTQPAGDTPYMPRIGDIEMPELDMNPVKAQDNGQSSRDALGGYAGVGNMHGFRTDDYGGDQKARNSVKNTFGRIASRYKNAPSSIDAVMADADFQRYFPNARKIEGGAGDKIDFGGVLSDFESGVPVHEVDVLGAADPSSDSAMGWTWQDQVNDGGGGPMLDAGGDDPLAALGGGGASALDMLGNSDVLAQILQSLQQTNSGEGEDLIAQLSRGR